MAQAQSWYKHRSDYWGSGHWLISEPGRDMGRVSQTDDGTWSVYLEILPPPNKGKKPKPMIPIAEGVQSIEMGYRALADHWLREDARRSGQEHGWDHANYIEAYGPGPKLKPGEPGAMAKTIPHKYMMPYHVGGKRYGSGTPSSQAAYKAGWAQGVRWYKAGKTNTGKVQGK